MLDSRGGMNVAGPATNTGSSPMVTQNSTSGGWDFNGQNYGNMGDAINAYNSYKPSLTAPSVPSSGQQPTGNPSSAGGSTLPPQSQQNQGGNSNPAWDQNVQNAFDNFNRLSGPLSSSDLAGPQQQAQNFANYMWGKANNVYNSAVNHAASDRDLALQQAGNTYDRAQKGLQTDSFLSYLKGQDGLANRGVAGTGGAMDDLNSRTSLEYQRQLSGLLNNYQLAQQQAQKGYGDAQYSAQQALQQADPTMQTENLYRQLVNDMMMQRGRQAQGAASMFDSLYQGNQRAIQNQYLNQFNQDKLQQDWMKTVLDNSTKENIAQLPYQYQTMNNAANLAEKHFEWGNVDANTSAKLQEDWQKHVTASADATLNANARIQSAKIAAESRAKALSSGTYAANQALRDQLSKLNNSMTGDIYTQITGNAANADEALRMVVQEAPNILSHVGQKGYDSILQIAATQKALEKKTGQAISGSNFSSTNWQEDASANGWNPTSLDNAGYQNTTSDLSSGMGGSDYTDPSSSSTQSPYDWGAMYNQSLLTGE